ncbi:Gfo/Idh/MocA family oxidoreductase [Candidatus Frankia alpina]|uniref:Gfo/Idh/MocA family protein n=1 Tax=Candidatus Frankia alpina TaxID=2699483 RepID=UPI001F487471|nr:Gfo/Idh/MocA family oxidoreductase [Candidatus Frankia alpina]
MWSCRRRCAWQRPTPTSSPRWQPSATCCSRCTRRDGPTPAIARCTRPSGGEPLRLALHRGGLRRPAGTWRDDERISGGQLYERGAAGVDQVLALVDEPVEWVSASELKRVWYHVSNADHSQLLLDFANGAQAQITVSDLTVAVRPCIEVLGSAGTLILDDAPAVANPEPFGDEPVVSGRHAGRRAAQDDAADGPASLLLATYDGVRTRLPLPAPGPGGAAAFYRDLADCLVSGWPLVGYGIEAARPVVAVLEAAVRSAASGGAQVVPL